MKIAPFYVRHTHTLAPLLISVLVLAALLVSSFVPKNHARSVELGIAAHSPLGFAGGAVVPASCPSYDHGTGGACASCPLGYSWTSTMWSDVFGNPFYVDSCVYTGCPAGYSFDGTYCNYVPPSPPPPPPPPCVGNNGASCTSAPNACGQTNPGAIQCNGSCSAVTPSNAGCPPPSFSCQGGATTCTVLSGNSVVLSWSCPAPNSTASGVNFSTGGARTGSVQVTPVANTTYTVVCGQTGTQASVQVNRISPTITLTATPTRVHPNSSSVLTWGATQVTNCVLSGPAGTLSSATANTNGTVTSRNTTTPIITGQSTFTLDCQTVAGLVSASIDVSLIPVQIEI